MLRDCWVTDLLLFVKIVPCLLVYSVVGRCGVVDAALTKVNRCPLDVVRMVDDFVPVVGVNRTCRRIGVVNCGVCMSCCPSNLFRKLIFGD